METERSKKSDKNLSKSQGDWVKTETPLDSQLKNCPSIVGTVFDFDLRTKLLYT